MKAWCLMFAIGCGSTSSSVAPRERVPEAVEASARKLAGGAHIDRIEREHDGYEVTWHVNGLEREATMDENGVVRELEVEVAPGDVPAVVRDAASAKLGVSAGVTFVRLQDGRWEAEALVDGHEREVLLAPDGKALGDDDGDDDDHDDDDDDDDDDDESHDD